MVQFQVDEWVSASVSVQEVAGRGRGVVAERPLSEGELVVVSGALGMASECCDIAAFDLRAGGPIAAVTYQLVRAVVDGCARRPDFLRRLEAMYVGDYEGPKGAVDRARAEWAVKLNAFQVQPDWFYFEESVVGGLWDLPGRFNHSCVANCYRVFLGNVMLIRALRAVAAGEELTLHYVPPTWPAADRQKELQTKYHFACDCSLCRCDLDDAERRAGILARERAKSRRKGGDIAGAVAALREALEWPLALPAWRFQVWEELAQLLGEGSEGDAARAHARLLWDREVLGDAP